MKKKVWIIFALIFLFIVVSSLAFAQAPPAVTRLKAEAGVKEVSLTWDPVDKAEGYIIYRKVGKTEKFSYLYITENPRFIDKNASVLDFNYYRVYSYVTVEGKKIVSDSDRYVYAQAISDGKDPITYSETVKGLKIMPGSGHIQLSWTEIGGADGYYIFRRGEKGNPLVFPFVAVVSTNKCDVFGGHSIPCMYRVYPYKVVNGIKIMGKPSEEVLGVSEKYEGLIGKLRGFPSENGKVQLNWDPVIDATAYEVAVNGERNFVHETSYLHTVEDTSEGFIYYIRPYKEVKGNKIMGQWREVLIRAKKESDVFYSGRYEIGTDLPLKDYTITRDEDLKYEGERYYSIIKDDGKVHIYSLPEGGAKISDIKEGDILINAGGVLK